MYSDNQAAISISSSASIPHSRTKHIDIRHHYVRECILGGEVKVNWLPSNRQLADVFTKGLTRNTFEQLVKKVVDKQQEKEEEEKKS